MCLESPSIRDRPEGVGTGPFATGSANYTRMEGDPRWWYGQYFFTLG